MTARTRIEGIPWDQGGKAHRVLGGSVIADITQNPLGTRENHQCDDVIGNSDGDNALSIVHKLYNLEKLNGIDFVSATNNREYSDFYPEGLLNRSLQHVPILGIPSASSDATTVLARTNPGRAEVSLPVFVGEMRDLPHMIKSAGDFLLKRRKNWFRSSAGQYLSWQFGWKPLMNDLRNIVTFQANVDKRVQELERLYSKGGLKRRLKLGNWGGFQQSNVTVTSVLGTTIQSRESRFTQMERWGTVRWRPTQLPPSISRRDLQRQAFKAVFGVSIQAVDVWNLMPWSWLVDWFTNTGDFLEAHANRVPASPGPVNIMTKGETAYVWTRTTAPNWVQWQQSSADYITKDRYVGGGTLSATLPFLSGRQMSILGALAVTRAKGSHRFTA